MFIEESIYKKIMENAIIITIDLMCINTHGEILLGLRNNAPLKDIYYLPWWRIFKYENIFDAAKRKALDEIWIDIDIKKLQFLWVYDDVYPNDSFFPWWWSHYTSRTYLYHLSKSEEQNIHINDNQHKGLKFFNPKDDSLHDMLQDRINDFIKSENI
ncbi:MAG: Gdp-mannose mannosyl hydrolase [uncultured bacterium (gcode 4)]|uniref:Gdp-mannose mannosyl hydrolase n=1 Tax=uncultured bacterium (gcode 4) TaxID=1234023 RepID=K1XI49_9BACT|nr:MAG: Gdp-mannose mannosyl hydrolase [uncultured bacterium (gcode 4)]